MSTTTRPRRLYCRRKLYSTIYLVGRHFDDLLRIAGAISPDGFQNNDRVHAFDGAHAPIGFMRIGCRPEKSILRGV